jgi:signal transduction histidine kinase/ActR/RegA family two-component response regulator
VSDDPYLNVQAGPGQDEIVAFAGYPLVVADQMIGVLALYFRESIADDFASSAAWLPELLAMGIGSKLATDSLNETKVQLQQSEKRALLGRMVAGVAHDFNNLVTVLCGYGEMVASAAGRNVQLRRDAEEIRKAAQRAATLTRQLLGFSREQPIHRRPLDLNGVITDLTTMLGRLIHADIELRTKLDPNLAPVRVDSGQLEQVIVNLVVNARDAMPNGGRLLDETTHAVMAEGPGNNAGNSPAGQWVVLSVSDTGCGIDAHDLPNIFEPYFSTKPTNRGTGLGLAMVQDIVTQNGGRIDVNTQPGRGTTFRITFPRAEDAAHSIYLSEQRRLACPGTETILLAENDEQVRRYIRDALCDAGYIVLDASDGAEAARLLNKHRGRIGLVLADVAMPRVAGNAIAERVAREASPIRLILMSGHPDVAVADEKCLPTTSSVLRKPFGTDELLRCVRAAIDRADCPPQTLAGFDSIIEAA